MRARLANIFNADKAREKSIRQMQKQFDQENLQYIFDRIEETTDKHGFFLRISIPDEISEMNSDKTRRLLMEFMRLNGYVIHYFGDSMEIRWQI